MMLRSAFTAFCMCIGVQSEDLVSMLQTNRLTVDRTSQTVTVKMETCDIAWSGSTGKFTIKFDGDGAEYPMGPFTRGKTDTFTLGVGSGADLSRFKVKAHGSDGWCASSLSVNGNHVLEEETWFDNPCTKTHSWGVYQYDGIACFPSFKFGPLAETSVSVTSCATKHAQSWGAFYIQFDGDTEKRLLGQMKSAGHTYKFDVDHDAAADLLKFSVSTDQADGLCATSIVVNGKEAMGQGSVWIDNPCTTYHYDGTSCHPSYTFDLTPAPIEIALPEFDLNEGNACKHGYKFIRSKDDCKRAASVLKFAGKLGTFMAKEREVTNRPSGCYMQTNEKQAFSYRRVIYNTHETGAASVQAMIICKKA